MAACALPHEATRAAAQAPTDGAQQQQAAWGARQTTTHLKGHGGLRSYQPPWSNHWRSSSSGGWAK